MEGKRNKDGDDDVPANFKILPEAEQNERTKFGQQLFKQLEKKGTYIGVDKAVVLSLIGKDGIVQALAHNCGIVTSMNAARCFKLGPNSAEEREKIANQYKTGDQDLGPANLRKGFLYLGNNIDKGGNNTGKLGIHPDLFVENCKISGLKGQVKTFETFSELKAVFKMHLSQKKPLALYFYFTPTSWHWVSLVGAVCDSKGNLLEVLYLDTNNYLEKAVIGKGSEQHPGLERLMDRQEVKKPITTRMLKFFNTKKPPIKLRDFLKLFVETKKEDEKKPKNERDQYVGKVGVEALSLLEETGKNTPVGIFFRNVLNVHPDHPIKVGPGLKNSFGNTKRFTAITIDKAS